jgi:H+/Cl- antiporter ClcA
MNMPLTALVLVVEFTRVDHGFLVPMLCAVAGSVAVNRLLEMKMEACVRGVSIVQVEAERV